MSVATLKNGSLQLSELVISNEKYSNATGYVASSSTFTAGLTGTSLSSLTTTGNLVLSDIPNSSSATFNTNNSLTITRNLNGKNEIDFVAINTGTPIGMSFYASQSAVTSASVPSLSVTTTGIEAPEVVADSITLSNTDNCVLSSNTTGNLLVNGYPLITSAKSGPFGVAANVQTQAQITFPVYFKSTDTVVYTAYSESLTTVICSAGTYQSSDEASSETIVQFNVESTEANNSVVIVGIAFTY